MSTVYESASSANPVTTGPLPRYAMSGSSTRSPDSVVTTISVRSALAPPVTDSPTVRGSSRRNRTSPSTTTGHAVSAVVVANMRCTQ